MRFCCAIVFTLLFVGIGATPSNNSGQESRRGLEQQQNVRRPISMLTHKPELVRDRLLKGGDAAHLDSSDEERVDLTKIFKFRKKTQIISTDELPRLWMKKELEPAELYRTTFGATGVAGVGLHGDMFLPPWLKYVNMYRGGLGRFEDFHLISLLQQTKSDKDIVEIFHQLRAVKGMEKFADSLQLKMFYFHPATREAMVDAWITTKATPDAVFDILGLRRGISPGYERLYQWLRFASKSKAVSEEDMLTVLTKSSTVYTQYAGLLQVIKDTSGVDDELRRLAERLQNIIFKKLLEIDRSPLRFGKYVGPNLESWRKVIRRGSKDPYYKTLEAYTVAYAAKQGGEALRTKVENFFINLQPYEAVMATERKVV
ncbi:unnamed protein product [Phytophthora fragariaefolia]|uniref:Unnamed protein product n=1 Tax=Phytophthora fragariaefolia TaxID=1490495 RepID=A0A9W6YF10_9STRA|nr:unnamed protein product [Phytophthora fragariaefolia]